MDNKAVYARTSKGEDEISGRTSGLYSAIKRVLLMVDGSSTFGEISKRSAPSMRSSLDEMFKELEKGGFIHDKAKAAQLPKMAVPPKMAIPTKMSVPNQAPPSAKKPAQQSGDELDFMGEFFSKTPAQIMAEAAKHEKHVVEVEAKPRQEPARDAEAERLKAQQEAEAIRKKAEQDAARIREEAERDKKRLAAELAAREEQARRAREEAEAVRKKAALEAEQLQKELEENRKISDRDARERAEAEERERLEAAARAQKLAEEDRVRAAQEALKAHEAAERVARLEREAAMARLEEEKRALEKAEAERKKREQEAAEAREAAERLAKLEREAAAARAEAERLAKQRAAAEQSARSSSATSGAGPAPDIKLDPVFMLDPFRLPGTSTDASNAAPSNKPVDSVDIEPEIKLDPSIFEKPKAPTPKREENKPSAEDLRRAEEQRIAEEEEAKKRAEAELIARKKEEAEQREAEAAKARAELTFQQTLPPRSKFNYEAQKNKHSRARKPFPFGKLILALLVLAVGALFILPYALPMRDYVPMIEKELSARLQQPVHIGQLNGRFLPTPRMELIQVDIGDLKQFQVKYAQLDFSIFGVLNDIKPIDSIEMQDVKVTGTALTAVAEWLQQIAADNKYPVRRMVIAQGSLESDVVPFSGVNGEVVFNPAGKFNQANFRANGGKLSLGISAIPDSKPQINLTLYSGTLPLLPGWTFDELTAKGELSSVGIRITEFDGRIAGGILQGGVDIDWRSGWQAKGPLVAKTIPMEKLSKGISGDLEGTGRFQMQSPTLASLVDTMTMEGTFIIKRGIVNGIDIVETARTHSKESPPGGRTHFDELTGVLSATPGNYSIKQMKMDAGTLVVNGALDIDKQQLSGKISADLSKWAGMGKVTLQVVGTTDNPALRATR